MKTVPESVVVMHELVLPNDTNILGNVLGGRVMHLIDICAAMSAYKHARSPVVTASIDHLNFLSPAKTGDMLILKSSVNYVSSSSMEIGVRVESENTITGKIKHTASAHLTFVALDENRKPKKIGKIIPSNKIERTRYDSAKKRVDRRKEDLGK
ncbi:MAG: acyl-CoA thioesterase [Candidatus Marinimicrobia bacterium]|nr:acyl-CoA thioesterase [Candidatus Neomarinimicrobiota bacterium]